MKVSISVFVLILSMAYHSFAFADSPGIHGMLVFGGGINTSGGSSPIYFSHLPMFHSPHEYQIIAEMTFDPAAAALFDKSAASSPEIFTFLPERFVLPEMMRNGNCFHGDLYRGHFERGGVVVFAGTRVCVKSIVYSARLNASTKPQARWSGFLFGEGPNAWLVHLVSSRPGFDQVIQVVRPAAVSKSFPSLSMVTIARDDLPMTDQRNRQIEIDTAQGREIVNDVRNYYLETGDLE